MSKILLLFFVILISTWNIYASDKLKIISRSEWWADESYRDQNSSFWKNIFTKRAQNAAAWKKTWASLSQARKNEITEENRIANLKFSKMNAYLTNNYYNDIKLAESSKYEWDTKLVWKINKTNYIKNITIHHTYTEYKDSISWVKSIYKYHALSRQWWDIWYNYAIWYDWEVYEWRAWWDYVIGSHDTWNNRSTVGIVVMWDYDKRELTDKQYRALKKLVQFLTKKYWIDLNQKVHYHKECFWSSCQNALSTKMYYPIVWHKDWKETSCPWFNIYEKIIPRLLSELQEETLGYQAITLSKSKSQKAAYSQTVEWYNWESIRVKFFSLPQVDQVRILYKVKDFLKYENWWKKDMLYQRLLEAIS